MSRRHFRDNGDKIKISGATQNVIVADKIGIVSCSVSFHATKKLA